MTEPEYPPESQFVPYWPRECPWAKYLAALYVIFIIYKTSKVVVGVNELKYVIHSEPCFAHMKHSVLTQPSCSSIHIHIHTHIHIHHLSYPYPLNMHNLSNSESSPSPHSLLLETLTTSHLDSHNAFLLVSHLYSSLLLPPQTILHRTTTLIFLRHETKHFSLIPKTLQWHLDLHRVGEIQISYRVT